VLFSGDAEAAVQGQGTAAGRDQHEGDDDEGKCVFGAGVAVVTVDGPEGDEQVAEDEKGPEAGKKAEEKKEAAEELRDDRDVAEPVGQAERDDEAVEGLEAGEGVGSVETAGWNELLPAMDQHGDAEDEAEQSERPGLEFGEGTNHIGFKGIARAASQCGLSGEGIRRGNGGWPEDTRRWRRDAQR
jgi:hypothetical protein